MPKPRPVKPVLALGTTAVGLAVVLGLHPHGSSAVLASASSGPSSAGAGGAPRSTTTSTSQPPSVAGQSSPTTAAPGGARTATGKLEQYGYGELAVRVTVNGTRITKVVVAKLQVAEPTSAQYAAQADPMLVSQALQMQTWKINGLSGATYSSEAFAYSLQSALNQLHFA